MFDRLRRALPDRQNRVPFIASYAVALLNKVPQMAINTAGTVFISEIIRNNSDLIPLGIAAYAILNGAACAFDGFILNRDGVSGSAKANTVNLALSVVLPGRRSFNAALSEIGVYMMNVLGISPDLSAPATSAMSLLTGDPTYVVAQRLSALGYSFVGQVPYDVLLYFKNRKRRTGIN